jgi:hypothetical protein
MSFWFPFTSHIGIEDEPDPEITVTSLTAGLSHPTGEGEYIPLVVALR